LNRTAAWEMSEESATLRTAERAAGAFVGPLVVGALLNTWLFGIYLMQIHTYFRRARCDIVCVQVVVGLVLTIILLDAVLQPYVAYTYAVKDFGNVQAILGSTHEFAICVVSVQAR